MSSVLKRLEGILKKPVKDIAVLQPVANDGVAKVTQAVHKPSYIEGEGFSFKKGKVIDVVEGQDMLDATEPHRHNQNFIHVSDLMNCCPRAYILGVRHNSARYKYDFLSSAYSSSTNVVWAQGRATEAHIRKQFIKRFGDQVFGLWVCPCKASRYEGVKNKKITCKVCNRDHDYEEKPIYDYAHNIVGTADMPLLVDNELIFCEIKSIKKDEFVELTGPKPEHITQVGMYREMNIRLGVKTSNTAVVIYGAKEFLTGSVYKEFKVDLTPGSQQFVDSSIRLLYAKAKLIKDALENRTVPPRIKKCASVATSTAKNCPMCVDCFSMP